MAERLAWEPGADDVDGFDLVPVEHGQVAQVRHSRMVRSEHLRCVLVYLRAPDGFDVEHLADAGFEAAVSRAQAA
jgi:hypothetical protein|tara:strand:+ start:986 stop:1210 length:225 start_codon:yes stop_codon:yes gene_type:complete